VGPRDSSPAPSLANRPPRRRALISLTPLIDVVFILLVFFMLASSFLDWRAIELSAPARLGGGSSVEGALLVEVRSDGIRLSGRPVALDQLSARVGELLTQNSDRQVLVKAGDGVPLQAAVAVLDRLAAAGATGISLLSSRAAGTQ